MYDAPSDYDYTLCHYKEELQHLIYSMARDYLVRTRYKPLCSCR